jgi:hypothetical protein
MTLHDRIQLILQQWLAANNEDAMWLRGAHGRERQAAYERALEATARTLIREVDWRDWLTMQSQVRDIVREMLSKGTQ